MIIKGTSCAGARRLSAHLTRTDTNERAEVKEIRGTAADDLSGALKEMEAVAGGTRTTKPFYHGSINTRADERLSDEQRMVAIDRLEEALGLTGQPRVVVVHEKEGREHCHIVWSRIDLDRMAAISDSHNYRKHEEVARALEREFGHERVQGAHVERDGKERPERTPSHSEMLQAERTGLSTAEAKTFMAEIWRTTKNGHEFKAVLEDKGWLLARGDRRDFVAIDPKGGVHSIARRIDGVKLKDIRKRMSDLEPAQLSNVRDAKAIQKARQVHDAMFDRSIEQEGQLTQDEKKPKPSSASGLEWTDRAGLVEQERAAMEWVRKTHDEKAVQEKAARPGQFDDNHKRETGPAPTQNRKDLLRALRRHSEVNRDNHLGPRPDRGRTR